MSMDATFSNDHFAAAERLTADNVAAFMRGLPARAQVTLKALVNMNYGALNVRMPDARTFRVEGAKPGPEATVVLHNWNLPQRAFMRGTIGVGESYMDHDWDSPDVTAFLELFLVNMDLGEKYATGGRGILQLFDKLRHWLNINTRSQSKRNIAAHYDLGNAFYKEWLDTTMTYSSALYQTGANDLQSAQTAKYRALAEATGIGPNDHVLEIGCGWGGFAEFAASEIGCKVTGLTISREQLAYAEERIQKAGLSDRATFKFQDYRDETGVYDRIISIEMLEAVGEKFWATYFGKLRDCLREGGRAGIQAITIASAVFPMYRSQPDFIQRYVFPGGMLPTNDHLRTYGDEAGLTIVGNRAFAADYARTLAEWRERFWARWETIRPLGFDERFKRLWEFYLFYCEAGFRAENINVRQVVYAR
ncbi:class I SAM-dependent methyltransferase [Georhizobium profundi]|jgi:cyclopropane-fatty-acyl-phospholipid synthase|uniref:Class I SAM-dependent methyltransferase n=2 Tax=Georhizobium profundi TaxID=2341112 RepID=A0A3Q8XPV7_9HYPH|nr:class I SAM-dependent methyltransferase [Georhizobium profundi]